MDKLISIDEMLERLRSIDAEMKGRVQTLLLDQVNAGLNPVAALNKKGRVSPSVNSIVATR